MSAIIENAKMGGYSPKRTGENEIDAILNAIGRTDEYAKSKGSTRDLILVMGNTNAGKSAFVNYLLDNELVEVKMKGAKLGRMGFVLKNPSQADPEIGCGFDSKTDFPGFYDDVDKSSNLTFCDCPGFFDSRGAVFDISNMYALAKMAETARSIKGVVVLIDYHVLVADRGRGMHGTFDSLCTIFDRSQVKNSPSLLLLMTQAPSHLEKSDVSEFMVEAGRTFPTLEGIVEKAEQYDPLDRYCSPPFCRLSREDIFARFHRFPGFPKKKLNISLSPESLNSLGDMLRTLTAEATAAFDEHNAAFVNSFLGTVAALKILKCAVVSDSHAIFSQHMSAKVSEWAADLCNLDMMNDLKVEVPEIEGIVQAAIKTMLSRIEVEKAHLRKVDVLNEDLLLAQNENKQSELKLATMQAANAEEKKKLEAEREALKVEADRLRAEAQRVQTVSYSNDMASVQHMFAQMVNQRGGGHGGAYGGGGGYPGYGGDGFDLSNQLSAMSLHSSGRGRGSGSGSGGGRTYVSGYTRSNGTKVAGHYRKCRKK